MNFNLHFGELHSDTHINNKNNLFENYIPKCYYVKIILISFNCFSEYINNLPYSDKYFNTDWHFEMFKKGKPMDMILV